METAFYHIMLYNFFFNLQEICFTISTQFYCKVFEEYYHAKKTLGVIVYTPNIWIGIMGWIYQISGSIFNFLTIPLSFYIIKCILTCWKKEELKE
jgi:hypothetical protein